ncbi:MAG TPA: exodeoxyribonuclease V subunit alpha [Capillimicrobium sp.]|nr:exodeoxyribonuclease V subunit alpha [Capillimicrobium sp.]
MPDAAIDPRDPARAVGASGLLRTFNDAGILAAADVHVAMRLGRLARVGDEDVLLAAALAVRAPRLGHVRVDLATIRETVAVDAEEAADATLLPWPEPGAWTASVAACDLVAVGDDAGADDRPLRLVGTSLYLDRYWREERRVAADLEALARPVPDVDVAVLAAGVARLFDGDGDGDRRQRLAAASAVLRRFAVVAGGPGTGKTTTVARVVALLAEQAEARGTPPPLVALAAPTGKAAARLEEAVRDAAADLPVSPAVREQLLGLGASTLHRLLGWRPGSRSRFRHHRGNRLPHDVVIVDETSMVSLSLMARLVEAVRPGARLVLVGDPGQLTSIEAGVVLGDIVGPTSGGLRIGADARARLEAAVGEAVDASDPPAGAAVADGIVVLDRVHRYGGAIARVAEAIRRGDADAVVDALAAAPAEVRWIDADAAEPGARDAVAAIRADLVAATRSVIEAAAAGDARTALAGLGAFRLLCAHRRGPHGVAWWTPQIESWLAEDVEGFARDGRWYAGRQLLVTENDYGLRLYNGDTGVVVATGDGAVAAAFDRGGEPILLRPGRLSTVETVYAMTVHKSQGSQFGTAAVLLPPPASPILTRELLYTAVTRARERLVVVGTEEAVRAAVARPAARASGLRWRLWGGGEPSA